MESRGNPEFHLLVSPRSPYYRPHWAAGILIIIIIIITMRIIVIIIITRPWPAFGRQQALTGSDFQLWVGSGSELKSRVVGYPLVG